MQAPRIQLLIAGAELSFLLGSDVPCTRRITSAQPSGLEEMTQVLICLTTRVGHQPTSE